MLQDWQRNWLHGQNVWDWQRNGLHGQNVAGLAAKLALHEQSVLGLAANRLYEVKLTDHAYDVSFTA
ncbi:hypothetical protein PaeBR_04155 [Paenibacillus sp. BR2-3]|uniref:hypothetical protein n=1 Tax=Paenibacillus sp. BR2-3 TaxID=3048494 RepID=UPI003977CF11